MIRYLPKLMLTLDEIKDEPSLLIHALTGCMFHCFRCFNYEELVEKVHDEVYEIDDVVAYIQKQDHLFDNIILSGGELMLAPLESLISDLGLIRKATQKPVIIYTTGLELAKMKNLHDRGLVDGYHIDMKLPYHLLTDDDYDLIEMTMGIRLRSLDLIKRLEEALAFVVETDAGKSQIRSVRYPFLDETAFAECKFHVDALNHRYNKSTPYFINAFIDPEATKK